MREIIIPLQKLEKGITTTNGILELGRLDGFLDSDETLKINSTDKGISIVFGHNENFSTSIAFPCTGLPRIIQRGGSEKAIAITPLRYEAFVNVFDIDIEKDNLLEKFIQTAVELLDTTKLAINDDPNKQLLIYTDGIKERPPALIISRSTDNPYTGIELIEDIPYFVFFLDGFEFKIRTSRKGNKANFGRIITPELVKTNYLEFLEMLFLMKYIATNNTQE